MGGLVYFSSVSGNTHRFVSKLDLPARRLPLTARDPFLKVCDPYVLVVPTYGGGHEGGAVPKQVIKFLNDEDNRNLIRGVIAAGNTNFGQAYCIAGPIIASKCKVPYLYGFELMGTAEDVTSVREGLGKFWQQRR
ncbi:MAG: class Ib ribonucleoside-diphosphate reductase assembly flavoprotein NrdI [Actinomycetota bacterium]|nr:class Ib ribonucleoside-diphosphate reductase assembly flavoprotein NrdI [Actinomycetota bacterium]